MGLHWIHLRTTKSTFTAVRVRARGIKGTGLAMAFKLLTRAEKRWHKVNEPHLVALVQAGVQFPVGKTRLRPDMPSDSVVNLPVDTILESAVYNI